MMSKLRIGLLVGCMRVILKAAQASLFQTPFIALRTIISLGALSALDLFLMLSLQWALNDTSRH